MQLRFLEIEAHSPGCMISHPEDPDSTMSGRRFRTNLASHDSSSTQPIGNVYRYGTCLYQNCSRCLVLRIFRPAQLHTPELLPSRGESGIGKSYLLLVAFSVLTMAVLSKAEVGPFGVCESEIKWRSVALPASPWRRKRAILNARDLRSANGAEIDRNLSNPEGHVDAIPSFESPREAERLLRLLGGWRQGQ